MCWVISHMWAFSDAIKLFSISSSYTQSLTHSVSHTFSDILTLTHTHHTLLSSIINQWIVSSISCMCFHLFLFWCFSFNRIELKVTRLIGFDLKEANDNKNNLNDTHPHTLKNKCLFRQKKCIFCIWYHHRQKRLGLQQLDLEKLSSRIRSSPENSNKNNHMELG